jgi:hypothetical protein
MLGGRSVARVGEDVIAGFPSRLLKGRHDLRGNRRGQMETESSEQKSAGGSERRGDESHLWEEIFGQTVIRP